jgi:hypothetical protein
MRESWFKRARAGIQAFMERRRQGATATGDNDQPLSVARWRWALSGRRITKAPRNRAAWWDYWTGLVIGPALLVVVIGWLIWTPVGAAIFVRPYTAWWQARHWLVEDATIIRAETVVREDGKHRRCEPLIRYRYGDPRQPGHFLKGDRYREFIFGSSWNWASDAIVARFPPGSVHPCYVDPAQPERAVLDRSFPWQMMLLAIFFIAYLWPLPCLALFLKPDPVVVAGPGALPGSVDQAQAKRALLILMFGYFALLMVLFILVNRIEVSAASALATIAYGGVLLCALCWQWRRLRRWRSWQPRVVLEATAVVGGTLQARWSVPAAARGPWRMITRLHCQEELREAGNKIRWRNPDVVPPALLAEDEVGAVRQGVITAAIPVSAQPTIDGKYRIVWTIGIEMVDPRGRRVAYRYPLSVSPGPA